MTQYSMYPYTRMRRLRKHPFSRALTAESTLTADDLVWPVFVTEGTGVQEAVPALLGVVRYSIDELLLAVTHAHALGIRAVALFPVVQADAKTADAREALNPENLVCRAIRAIASAIPDIGIIADVALDPYTTHGHDGIVGADGDVDNDVTIDVLCAQAVMLAKAGAHMVAPSDMMDGRVRAIRVALEEAACEHTLILAYTAKYASALYGPFRHAVGSQQALGKADKRTYQMNPANAREAMLELQLDVAEGADIVMVKPGLPYLDVVHAFAKASSVPVAVYQVSGEYAMIKAAAVAGLIDADAVMFESLIAFKRAGADIIFTYAACDIARMLRPEA